MSIGIVRWYSNGLASLSFRGFDVEAIRFACRIEMRSSDGSEA